MEGYTFVGWYDTNGNRVSTNKRVYLTEDEATLEARFEEGEEPAADISATANEYGNVQFDYNAENDSLTLNMAPNGESYAAGAIYINGVEVAAGTGNTYVIENISSYADADGNIEIYVEFVQLTTEEPPKTGTVSVAGIAVALVAAGAAIVLLRKKQSIRG